MIARTHLFYTLTDDDWARSLKMARARREGSTARIFGHCRIDTNAKCISFPMTQLKMPITVSDAQALLGLLQATISLYTLHPDELKVEVYAPADKIIIFQLRTGQNDHPRLLGKGGVSYRTLRKIFKEIGDRHGVNIDIRLLSPLPLTTSEDPPRDWSQSTDFDASAIAETLQLLVTMIAGNELKIDVANLPGGTVFKFPKVEVDSTIVHCLELLLEWVSGKERRRFYLSFE